MSYTLRSHWPELSHMSIATGRKGNECLYSEKSCAFLKTRASLVKGEKENGYWDSIYTVFAIAAKHNCCGHEVLEESSTLLSEPLKRLSESGMKHAAEE